MNEVCISIDIIIQGIRNTCMDDVNIEYKLMELIMNKVLISIHTVRYCHDRD